MARHDGACVSAFVENCCASAAVAILFQFSSVSMFSDFVHPRDHVCQVMWEVLSEQLNVRSAPNSNAQTVGKVHRGERYAANVQELNYIQIKFGNGMAWLSTGNATKAFAQQVQLGASQVCQSVGLAHEASSTAGEPDSRNPMFFVELDLH